MKNRTILTYFFAILVLAVAGPASAQITPCANCNDITTKCEQPLIGEVHEICNRGDTGGGWCYSDNSGPGIPGSGCEQMALLSVDGILPELVDDASTLKADIVATLQDCRNRIRRWFASRAEGDAIRRQTSRITV
jgi:hypothetical protein